MEVINIAKFLLDAIPRIVDLVRQGRDPRTINLGEVISHDALRLLDAAKTRSEDYIREG